MSLGGWSGSDSAVTLAQFQAAVDAGEVRYYVDVGQGGGPGGDGGTSTSAEIAAWVEAGTAGEPLWQAGLGTLTYDLLPGSDAPTAVARDTVYDLAS